jgi:DNA polymerase-1
MKPLLILDCHYLCHRAFHAQRDLSFGGISTGVIYGFLKQIGHLKDTFQTDRVAFCFEGTTLYRRIDFPDYKMKRINTEAADPEKTKARGDLCRQIDALRTSYLRQIGFRNIFYYPGWESDDIMGRMAKTAKPEDEVILVTSDADMYQLLRPNVLMYCPTKKRLLTEDWFKQSYGIEPWQWAMVKAMAGCSSDGVPGIPGVGEITAVKFIKKQLPKTSAIYKTITSPEAAEIVQRNRILVELPYENVPTPTPEWDDTEKISTKGWNDVCARLGIKSMIGRAPVFSRRMLKEER